MSFPRPPRTAAANVSLGAVGGPRGIAAGGLRLLVEFISTYDGAAVKQLEQDLKSLEATQAANAKAEESRAKSLAKFNQRATQAQNTLKAALKSPTLQPDVAKDFNKRYRAIEAGLLGSPAQRKQAKQDFTGLLADMRTAGVLNAAEEKQVSKLLNYRKQQKKFSTELTNLEAKKNALMKDQVATEQQLTGFQRIKQALPQRLLGLAVGGLGALAGGAIIGVGFDIAQKGIEAVGNALMDIIDPARHAREEISDLSEELTKLSQAQGVSMTQAAVQLLKDLGVAADYSTAKVLAEAAAVGKLNEQTEKRQQLLDIEKNTDTLRQEAISKRAHQILEEARAHGQLTTATRQAYNAQVGFYTETYYQVNGVDALTLATQEYEAELARQENAAAADIAAKNQQAAAAYRLELAMEALAGAAAAYVDVLSAPINAKIESIQGADYTSKRTKGIQAQIDRLSGGGGGSNASQMRDIAEQRALILLRQRLRLMGTEINLEKYSGKFLLEAINAKIAALNKQAAAQDRVTKLQDLAYRQAKGIQRQQGETINDFLERRAQENRDILNERRNLEREVIMENLQDLRDKTQDEVDLAELAEQKKNAIAAGGRSARLKQLQQELKDSQAADEKRRQADIAAQQAKLKAIKEAADAALKYTTAEQIAEFNNYVRLAKTIDDLAALGGRLRGMYAGQEFLRGLLMSGILTGAQLKAVQSALSALVSAIRSYEAKRHNIITGHAVGKGPLEFASGGVIQLKNSQSPFGSNFQFGENGTEMGVILSRKVTQAIKDNMGGDGLSIGEININRSDDPYRDIYRFKKAVREAVREELRG